MSDSLRDLAHALGTAYQLIRDEHRDDPKEAHYAFCDVLDEAKRDPAGFLARHNAESRAALSRAVGRKPVARLPDPEEVFRRRAAEAAAARGEGR